MNGVYLGILAGLLFCLGANAEPQTPHIQKLGTIDCDLVETTPIVFHGKLYRFEYIRRNYPKNTTGDSYFHFVEVETGRKTPPFAKGYHLGSAMVVTNRVIVFGVKEWGADSLEQFECSDPDLANWTSHTILKLPGWTLFNTSACKGRDGYVLSFEIGAPPEECGVPFTTRFAESKDLKTWTVLPREYAYTFERYSACPALRYVKGYYYKTYLEAYPGPQYETCIVRSRDLKTWESSPFNPIMKHSDEDRVIGNPDLSASERERIAKGENINNSDVDFCTYKGKTIINYSWGDQKGKEFLAHAVYDGKEEKFLQAFFPKNKK